MPAAFLFVALAWGAGASISLAWIDAGSLSSRWSPALLALTHAFTLGVLGNALIGGLTQFLPAAAAGGRLGAGGMLAAGLSLNLGAACLILHFLTLLPAWPAALLLGLGLSTAAIGLMRCAVSARPPALSTGLFVSLVSLVLTIGAGVWLLAARSGVVAGPRLLLIDAHAMLGLWGWTFGVLLCVCSVAVPMLQGLARWSPRALPHLLGLNVVCLLLAIWLRAGHLPFAAATLAIPVLLAASLYVWQLVHAPWRRNLPLRAFFTGGAAMLGVTVVWLPFSATGPGLAIWGLGAGLTMLVLGMAIEILAFLAWIGLQRRVGRGRRLPGVHQLQGDAAKWTVFALVAAGGLLLGLGLGPIESLRSPGAALLAFAHVLALSMGVAGFVRTTGFVRAP